jgi:hypothetical protein
MPWVGVVSDPERIKKDLTTRVLPYLASEKVTSIGIMGFW